VNEVFKPEGQGVRQYTLKVFNRWGERVFEGRNEGWDGKLNGELVQPGVYFYTLKVRNAFNNLEFREGRLTVVR
jgi:gliding motility-associated-like protein